MGATGVDIVIITGTLPVSRLIVDLAWSLESLLQVLVACLRQRREAIVDEVLFSILILIASLPKLSYETLMHPVHLEERFISKSIIAVPVHIVHYIVVHR